MEALAWILPATAVLAWAGAVQATSLAMVFASIRTDPLPGRTLVVAQLALLALLSAVVLLSHQEALRQHRGLELLELGVWLLAGPLLLLYFHRVLGLADPSLAHFLPAPLFVLVAVTTSLEVGVLPFMVHQLAYTGVVVLRYRSNDRPRGRVGWWCRAWLGLLGAVHAAQWIRYFFSEVDALRNVVPLTAALGLFVISTRGLRGSALLRAPTAGSIERSESRGRAPVRRTSDGGAARGLGFRVLDLLERERLYLASELTVSQLATRLSVRRSEVSASLNRELGISFPDLVSHYRVEEAKRLLLDPGLDHLTVEAIGRRSGFGTRSTFHQRFRGEVGTTPSAFRLSEKRPPDKPAATAGGEES